MLQRVAVCCSVLQCADYRATVSDSAKVTAYESLKKIADDNEVACCSVWQCVVVCGNVWQCVAVCGNVWQCVAVCGSVWQCVVVCGSVW